MTDEGNEYEKMLKVLSVVIGIALIIGLVVVKVRVESFQWIWVILLGIGVIGISTLIFFGFELFEKFESRRKKEPEKKEITNEEARERAVKIVSSPMYSDYISIKPQSEKVYMEGKSKEPIYHLVSEGIFEPVIYHVLINKTNPLNSWSVLLNPSQVELNRAIKSLPSTPEEEPDKETIKEFSDLLGVEREITKTTKNKKKEDEKKKGDLE